jgi:hypothetical protein
MDIWALNILKFASTVESLPDALQGNRIGELFLLDSVVSPGGMDSSSCSRAASRPRQQMQ